MPRNRKQRRADDLHAMEVLGSNLDPVMAIVADAIDTVNEGQLDLPSCVQETRLVLDIAKRLDDALPTPEPVETWDRLLWVLVAGIALRLYRRYSGKGKEAKVAARVQEALRRARERAAAA